MCYGVLTAISSVPSFNWGQSSLIIQNKSTCLALSNSGAPNIHELLTPNLRHQLIKGTFKDHLVIWVEEYIRTTADSAAEAKHILNDIDRRLAAVSTFPGLHRFLDGRNFQQWTGNGSKALMKVFLPALIEYVPDKMIQCISALLDFSYFAQCSAHISDDLKIMESTLKHYHKLRTIFEEVGIWPNGFQLPCQHALVYYSKHIMAVKCPWRRSSRKHPLGQMVRTITYLNKLAATRVEFAHCCMLLGDIYQHSLCRVGINLGPDHEQLEEERYRQEMEAMASTDSEPPSSSVTLSARPVHIRRLDRIMFERQAPTLHACLRRSLYDQLHPEDDLADDILLAECPALPLDIKLSVFHLAMATFYTPSELAGPGGMHNDNAVGMLEMTVACVRLFISFVYSYVQYNCAFVDWFELESNEPDPVTGMRIMKPEMLGGQRATGVVHVDSIVRACHLIGCYGTTKVPKDFHYVDTLDAFYYHAHETII
ncbi:hypothetical protein LXA43DRAFT_977291 [Ganoderma leucocontextum]|nr:hypothetical protein LXA43DRAFT_977291 [Ganoderma leucocontextum]